MLNILKTINNSKLSQEQEILINMKIIPEVTSDIFNKIFNHLKLHTLMFSKLYKHLLKYIDWYNFNIYVFNKTSMQYINVYMLSKMFMNF